MDSSLHQSIRSIILSGKDPITVWGQLKPVAANAGPDALRGAIVELISLKGNDPRFAPEIPNLIRSAKLTKPEKVELLSFAERAPKLTFVPSAPSSGQLPITTATDPAALRDMPLRIKEQMNAGILPFIGDVRKGKKPETD